jgi:hypothetical protein
MVELEYSDVEMDVLCNNGGATFLGNPMMPSNTPSYRLGWADSSASTETLVQHLLWVSADRTLPRDLRGSGQIGLS